VCARRRQVSDLCGITIGSCSAQARFVSGLPSQKSGAFGQETALFGRSGLASCLRWCDPHPLSRPFTMALKNRVLDSACHIGEQHCGERRDIDVATGPLAKQQARRRRRFARSVHRIRGGGKGGNATRSARATTCGCGRPLKRTQSGQCRKRERGSLFKLRSSSGRLGQR